MAKKDPPAGGPFSFGFWLLRPLRAENLPLPEEFLLLVHKAAHMEPVAHPVVHLDRQRQPGPPRCGILPAGDSLPAGPHIDTGRKT